MRRDQEEALLRFLEALSGDPIDWLVVRSAASSWKAALQPREGIEAILVRLESEISKAFHESVRPMSRQPCGYWAADVAEVLRLYREEQVR